MLALDHLRSALAPYQWDKLQLQNLDRLRTEVATELSLLTGVCKHCGYSKARHSETVDATMAWGPTNHYFEKA